MDLLAMLRRRPKQPKLKAQSDGDQHLSPETGQHSHQATGNEINDNAELHSQSAEHEQQRSDVEHPGVMISEALSQRSATLEQSNVLHRRTVLGLIVSNVFLGAGWLNSSRQEREFLYFFTNEDGSVIEAKPLSDPIHSQTVIRNFLSSSIAELFSFHYRNVEMHLQRLAPNILTDKAFQDVVSELDRMGLVAQMKDRREVAVGTIPDTPVLTGTGVPNGVRTWEYAARINIMLEAAERSAGSSGRGQTRQLTGQLRAQLIRVDPEVHPRRILINRLQIFQDRG